MADSKDLNVKITSDTKQAEKDYKAYLDSITAAYKQHNAQVKASEQAQANLEKQTLRESEKLAKESLRVKSAAEKQLNAEKKSYLKDWENAIKQNNSFDIKAEKEKNAEKIRANKEYIKQLKFNSSIVNKQIADEQKAANKTANKKGMSPYQLLEFGENLTVVTAGLYAAITPLVNFSREAMTLGANLTVLKSNFKGTSQDLESFKLAVAGTLTEAELIGLSNRASDLGLSLKDQSIMFSIAEDAADKYGGAVPENFDRIVNAIAKGGRGLEQLGITTINYKKTVEELYAANNLTNESITEEERLNIGLQAVMKITGTTLEDVANKTMDVADQQEHLRVVADETKAAFGQGINVAFTDTYNLLNSMLKPLNDLTGGFVQLSDVARVVGEVMFNNIFVTFKKIFDTISENKELFFSFIQGLKIGGMISGGGIPMVSSAFGKGIDIPDRPIGTAEKAGLGRGFYDREISETAEDVGTITGAIATSMNALGVGTDNFVGKMLAGFDSALGIIQAIKTVNTVLSFIPGFASGGNFSGGSPIMVGERGAELIFPNTSGYVMNNYNSMKYLNSNSQPIYVGVNLNSMDIYTTGRKEFNNLSSQKRIN